jgi:uncharacterized repeat protein (TIGR01451 family)
MKFTFSCLLVVIRRLLLIAVGAFLLPAALFFLLASTSVQAQSSIIYVDAAATGADSGSSWTDAYSNLQDALSAAQSGDEIWVATGVYTPGASRSDSFNLPSGVSLYGSFAGTESTRDQRDWEANATVLSGDLSGDDVVDGRGVVTDTTNINGDNAFHVMWLDGTTTPITDSTRLDGVIITAGQANGGSITNKRGGGLYCNGAGVGSKCSPMLTNVTFAGNNGLFGGAMFSDGASGASSPTLTNVIFAGNSAGFYGGAMFNFGLDGVSSPILTNVTFSRNSANEGGGMYNAYNSNPSLTNVTFSSNNASENGGGIYNGGGHSTLTNVRFSSNSANIYGGGLFNQEGNPTLTGVSFTGNSADYGGGGLFNREGDPTLTNVTFSGNHGDNGGGMYNSSGHSTLTNVTFNGNSANEGGGMYNTRSSPTIANSIFWNNEDESGTGTADASLVDETGGQSTISYSLIEGWNPAGDGNLDGTDPNNNPLFVTPVNPADAPTTAGDLRLQAASPAIDAGDNDALPPDVSTDLDGNDRIVDGNDDLTAVVDMGAYEAPQLIPDEDALIVAKTVNNTTPIEGETITFTVTVSNTAIVRVTDVTVSDSMSGTLGSGLTLLAGETVTYTYGWTADDGPQTVENVAMVESAHTNPVSSTVTVEVQNVPPMLIAGSDQMVPLGSSVTVSATLSDPGADSHIATVDWGDGGGAQPASVDGSIVSASHTYAAAGVHTVTLCAEDGDEEGCTTLTVTVVDASVVVSPTSDLETTEAGGTDSFTVVLGDEPTGLVTVTLTSSDPGEGTVSPAVLTFDAGNWQTPQTVTVTGVDDEVLDGDVAYTVETAVSSDDPFFDGIPAADVAVMNQDDELPPPPLPSEYLTYLPLLFGPPPPPPGLPDRMVD